MCENLLLYSADAIFSPIFQSSVNSADAEPQMLDQLYKVAPRSKRKIFQVLLEKGGVGRNRKRLQWVGLPIAPPPRPLPPGPTHGVTGPLCAGPCGSRLLFTPLLWVCDRQHLPSSPHAPPRGATGRAGPGTARWAPLVSESHGLSSLLLRFSLRSSSGCTCPHGVGVAHSFFSGTDHGNPLVSTLALREPYGCWVWSEWHLAGRKDSFPHSFSLTQGLLHAGQAVWPSCPCTRPFKQGPAKLPG